MIESTIDSLREKPFMDRSGAEQEAVRDYWFAHVQDMETSLWRFMGMELKEYESWLSGDLKLNDGSYHEMEPSSFHISESIANRIRPEIQNEQMFLQELKFTAFLNGLMPERSCNGFVSPSCDCAMVYDPGGDLVAVISRNEIMHKEDFAYTMKLCEMDASEKNFQKVWPAFLRQKTMNHSLRESFFYTVLSQRDNDQEKGNRKPSLSEQIQSASSHKSKSISGFVEKAKEPVR